MLTAVKISTAAVGYPPPNGEKLTEFNLRKDSGDFSLTNGITGDLAPGQLRMLHNYGFAKLFKLSSRGATVDWTMYGENIWYSMGEISVANFFGDFPNDLICSLVSKCTNINALSFTYWKAPSFENIIYSIQSPKLIELTGHVNGTYSTPQPVLQALHGHGTIMNWKLERLMLFFDEAYNGIDVGAYCHEQITTILSSNAIVYIFLKSEKDACMDTLALRHRYFRAGYVNVAKNYHEVTVAHETVEFERYYLFQKKIAGITWNIGVKKLQSNDAESENPPMDSSPSALKDDSRFNVQRYVFDINHPSQQHQQTEFLQGSVLGPWGDERYREYNPVIVKPGTSSTCCTPKTDQEIQIPSHHYHAPMWEVTMVTVLAYLEKDTRFLFSNGLLFQLGKMNLETSFFKKMQNNVCPRLQILCTNQNRRWVQAVGMEEFLAKVRYVEFIGEWFADPFVNILERLPSTLTSMCMMQLKLDNWQSIHVWKELGENTRGNISKIFIDYRDMVELSLASAMNGFLKQSPPRFNGLESLLICARGISDSEYRTTLYDFIKECIELTVPGADITIIVHETPDLHSIQNLNLHFPIDVLVQGMYSSWTEESPKCMLMIQYYTLIQERTIHVIVPKKT